MNKVLLNNKMLLNAASYLDCLLHALGTEKGVIILYSRDGLSLAFSLNIGDYKNEHFRSAEKQVNMRVSQKESLALTGKDFIVSFYSEELTKAQMVAIALILLIEMNELEKDFSTLAQEVAATTGVEEELIQLEKHEDLTIRNLAIKAERFIRESKAVTI